LGRFARQTVAALDEGATTGQHPRITRHLGLLLMPSPRRILVLATLALPILSACAPQLSASAQSPTPAPAKPSDTEAWAPVPRVVTPGSTTAAPPSDAIVLFDGRDLSEWVATRDKSPAQWKVADGVLTVNKPAGNIETKRRFTDYQLHLEWRIPETITGTGQARGNSGVFLASTGPVDAGYELQILDSYNNATYVNGQTGSIYKQAIPLANATRKPGEWQTYDVIWHKPTFRSDGTVAAPATVTVFHNGVLVQDHYVLKGETVYIGAPPSRAYDSAPIKLQAHGDPSEPISFRNIWVRELGATP
jgi:hypothetical protein